MDLLPRFGDQTVLWRPARTARGISPGRHQSAALSRTCLSNPSHSRPHSSSSFLSFFSSQEKLVQQIHLPNNSKKQRFVSKAAHHRLLTWGLSTQARSVGCDESRGVAAESGVRVSLRRHHHLLQIICSLASDGEKFLEAVWCEDGAGWVSPAGIQPPKAPPRAEPAQAAALGAASPDPDRSFRGFK